MTGPPPLPQPTRAQNAMGFLAFVVAVAFAAVLLLRHELTPTALVGFFLFAGAGMWFVGPPLLQGYVVQVREVIPFFLRRSTDGTGAPVQVTPPADRAVVVHRPDASTVIVPPQAPPAVVAAEVLGIASCPRNSNG